MKITIKTINLNLLEKEKQIMHDKIAKFEHFLKAFEQDKGLNPPAEVEVIVSRETDHHLKGPVFKTAINLILPGKILRAEAEAERIDLCFQQAKEEAEREVKKYKEKKQSIFIKSMRKIKRMIRRP